MSWRLWEDLLVVQFMIQKILQWQGVSRSTNPDEEIAYGAAVYGANGLRWLPGIQGCGEEVPGCLNRHQALAFQGP